MTNTLSRIEGMLIGVAYGDAFGMPMEMWTPDTIQQRLGWVEDFLPSQPDSVIARDLIRGETTDDTAHMVQVVATLYEHAGKMEPTTLIRNLRHWSATSTKSVAVTGPSTERAFSRLDAGVPMEETGKTGTTNGAAMKAAPLGVVCLPNDLAALVEQVRMLCLPTHNTSTAIGGAVAVAAAVSYAVHTAQPNTNEMVETACRAARMGEMMGNHLPAPSVAARIQHGIQLMLQCGTPKEALDAVYNLIGTGLPSYEAVPAAFALAYLAHWQPKLCAVYCANVGGDTDTVGAIACAICGALGGKDAFKSCDIRLLEEVNGLCFCRMAKELASVILRQA